MIRIYTKFYFIFKIYNMKMLKLLQFIAPFPDSDILGPVRNSTGSRCVKKGVRKEKKSELSAEFAERNGG